MSAEPLVTLPLSDYHKLVDAANIKEEPFLIVGRNYNIEMDGNRFIALCSSQMGGTYHLKLPNGIQTIHINISLVKEK